MDLNAGGVLDLSDPIVWLTKPFVGTLFVRTIFDELLRIAPPEHRGAIEKQFQLTVRLRKKLKLDEARQNEARIFTECVDFLQRWEKRLQHGGPRHKLKNPVSIEQKVAMARCARSAQLAQLSSRLAMTSSKENRRQWMDKENGRHWIHDVHRWKEFTSLGTEQREIVLKVLPYIPKLHPRDRQRAKLAAFLAQFLSGLPIDIDATERSPKREIPNAWYSPGQAVKFVREVSETQNSRQLSGRKPCRSQR